MGRPKGSKNGKSKTRRSRAVVQTQPMTGVTLTHVGKVLRSNDLGSAQERLDIALALTGTN